jgi:uncharacterized membrane protein
VEAHVAWRVCQGAASGAHRVGSPANVSWFRFFLFLHVMGAIAALGPTLTYGLWIGFAERGDPATRAFVLATISKVDGRLATPSFIAQGVTGVLLILVGSVDLLGTPWLLVAIAIYVALAATAVGAYAPTFRLQVAAAQAVAAGDASAPARYAAVARRALAYGLATTVLTVVIVFLMVTKPALWD